MCFSSFLSPFDINDKGKTPLDSIYPPAYILPMCSSLIILFILISDTGTKLKLSPLETAPPCLELLFHVIDLTIISIDLHIQSNSKIATLCFLPLGFSFFLSHFDFQYGQLNILFMICSLQ